MNNPASASFNPSSVLRRQQQQQNQFHHHHHHFPPPPHQPPQSHSNGKLPSSSITRSSTLQTSNSRNGTNGNANVNTSSRFSLLTNPTSTVHEFNTPSNRAKRRPTLLSAPASTNKKRQSIGLHSSQLSQLSQLSQTPANSSNFQQQQQQQPPPPAPSLAGRQFLSSQTPSSQLTSSQHQQQQQQQQQPSYNATTRPVVDSRPLRDRTAQEKMQKDILAFLVSHRFEAVSTTPLNENILKSPTQRNFNDIFKFIILTIEPGYVFEKPVEQEIIPILKSYQYPYLNTISRSNFSAVGGQNNWPTFLGLLHWLVELSELLSNGLTDSSYEPDDDFDKIFVKCTMDCYGKFLREDENYEQEREEMEQRFALELQSYKNLIEEGAKRNLALEEKYAQLTAELKAKEEADRKTIALEDDHEKLKNYINQVKKMIPEWKTKLDLGERELEMLNEKLKQLHHEKATLDTELAKRGISIESVNKIHYERDSLSKANDAAHARVENIKDKLATRIFELETNLDELEGVLSEYNTSVQRLNYEDETKFQFGLKIKEDIQNTDRAFGRDEILANKTTNEEKTQLMAVLEQLRFQIAEDTKKIQTVKQESVGVQEMINSQRARVEDLQIQDTLAKRKCDEISHNFSRQQDDYMTQIEQTEQRARDIKMAMSSAVLNLERKLQDANIEHNATIEAIENKRREMGESLDKVVSYVLKFKLNVSERLMIMDDSMQKQQQSD